MSAPCLTISSFVGVLNIVVSKKDRSVMKKNAPNDTNSFFIRISLRAARSPHRKPDLARTGNAAGTAQKILNAG